MYELSGGVSVHAQGGVEFEVEEGTGLELGGALAWQLQAPQVMRQKPFGAAVLPFFIKSAEH